MKRRAFLKLLGIGAAAAVVSPTGLLSSSVAVVSPPAAEAIYGSAIYGFDLYQPARVIFPVLSPLRNAMPRRRTA